jgi:hypothetical protein
MLFLFLLNVLIYQIVFVFKVKGDKQATQADQDKARAREVSHMIYALPFAALIYQLLILITLPMPPLGV